MRRSYGRDFGLSLRMALGLGLVGLIYVVAELICVAITVAGLIDHDWQAAGGGLFIGALIVVGLLGQLHKSEWLVLRTARAEPDQRACEDRRRGAAARGSAWWARGAGVLHRPAAQQVAPL
jgi:hypothetical protein